MGHLRVQNGHFLYIFKGLVGASKKQKDAHLKMEHNGTLSIENGWVGGPSIDFV